MVVRACLARRRQHVSKLTNLFMYMASGCNKRTSAILNTETSVTSQKRRCFTQGDRLHCSMPTVIFRINRIHYTINGEDITTKSKIQTLPASPSPSPFQHALFVVQGAFVCVGENGSCTLQPRFDSRPCRPLRPSRQVKEILEGVSSSKWGRASVASRRGEAKPFGRQRSTRKQRLRPPGPRQRRGPTQVV